MNIFHRTDSDNIDFQELVALLDKDLAIRDGSEHDFYAQFNKIQNIRNVIVCYVNDLPVGCGAFKAYDERAVEIKRMFVKPTHRGQGIGLNIVNQLELWAAELHYDECILETGKKQPEAIGLYKKAGYGHIPNYGQYKGVDNSVCMKKTISENKQFMFAKGLLHYTIIRHIIDHGFAPDISSLAQTLQSTEDQITQTLYELQDYHGVVLHPTEPKIWVIHPFALMPTNFLVQSPKGKWWANCAWCSLGLAALLNEDLTITTCIGAYDEQVRIHILNGEVQEKNLYVHFPIPMKKAWDNVVYTCTTMLLFKNEEQVDDWCCRHNIPKGDIQPIDNVWQFSKKWYGNHLNPAWEKWTMQEAREIFSQFNLKGHIWDIETSASRF